MATTDTSAQVVGRDLPIAAVNGRVSRWSRGARLGSHRTGIGGNELRGEIAWGPAR